MLIFIAAILIYGIKCKVPIYETFIEGAKSGISTIAAVFPYILAILCAIGVFKNLG
jgi:spore maturation protein B